MAAESIMRIPSLVRIPSLSRVPSLSRKLSGSRGKQMQKTWQNVKVSVLCGLLTFVVLRSTIGAGRFGTPAQDFEELRQHLAGLRRLHRALGEVEDARRAGWKAYDEAAEVAAAARRGGRSWPSRRRRRARSRVVLVAGSRWRGCAGGDGEGSVVRAMKNRIDYCNAHGIEIYRSQESEAEERGGGGERAKRRELRAAMEARPGAEWLWWLGDEAVVVDMEAELPVMAGGYEGYTAVVLEEGAGDGWLRGASFLLRSGERALQWAADRSRPAAPPPRVAFLNLTLHAGGVAPAATAAAGARRPFLADFAGCDPCSPSSSSSSSAAAACLRRRLLALDLADRQLLQLYGLHRASAF